jgi:Na+/H+-dicarboxylate symporter
MILIISLGNFYIISDAGIYIFSLLILASFSSLFFYYSFAKYIEKEEVMSMVYFFSILIVEILYFIIVLLFKINLYDLISNSDYNIIDVLPMTSLIKGCYSFTVSYYDGTAASYPYGRGAA